MGKVSKECGGGKKRLPHLKQQSEEISNIISGVRTLVVEYIRKPIWVIILKHKIGIHEICRTCCHTKKKKKKKPPDFVSHRIRPGFQDLAKRSFTVEASNIPIKRIIIL